MMPSAARLNALVLLLCAMALASPLVEAVPGDRAYWFWTSRAAAIALVLASFRWSALLPTALGGVVVFLVFVPCTLQMRYRYWSGPETWCHDSVLQFEEAIRMLRAGKNPYREDFSETTLPKWQGWKENPAIHHFVYPPLLLYQSVPVEMLSRALLWKTPEKVPGLGARAYDQRLVVLAFFFGLLGLVWSRFRAHPLGVGITALVALNPWVGPFVVEGRNDAAMLFWIAAAWIAYDRGAMRWGTFFLGVAIATKTLLLPMIPFVAFAHRRDLPRSLALLLGPLVATSLPFLIADAPSFLNDLFGAAAGLGPHPFEIRGWGGLGFADLVLAMGWASSPQAYFPFGIFQVLAFAPCLVYGLKSLSRDGRPEQVFLWSAAAIFVVLFFGRFIHDNYVGSLLSIAVLAQTARTDEVAAGA